MFYQSYRYITVKRCKEFKMLKKKKKKRKVKLNYGQHADADANSQTYKIE